MRQEHYDILDKGVNAWNTWKHNNPDIRPDLSKAYLYGRSLYRVDFSDTDLSGANLEKADLVEANFTNANLSDSCLAGGNLVRAVFLGANLERAHFTSYNKTTIHSFEVDPPLAESIYENIVPAFMQHADLRNANLLQADLCQVDLTDANLSGSNLLLTNLRGANLTRTNFSNAKINDSDLSNAILYSTNLQYSTLSNCSVHGISVWKIDLKDTVQTNLTITDDNEPTITVDNLEVAQFIYLLLHNNKIRNIIDTLANKAVLILGRFTSERKVILDSIRETLRENSYVPILFDFDKPKNRDVSETLLTLASLSKFIIADISEPKSTPLESQVITPALMIPFVPIIQQGETPFSMFADLQAKHDWILKTISYKDRDDLLINFKKGILEQAEKKFLDIQKRKMKEKDAVIPIHEV